LLRAFHRRRTSCTTRASCAIARCCAGCFRPRQAIADAVRHADGREALQLLDQFQETLSRIASARAKGRGELQSIDHYITRTIEELEEAFKNRETRGASGISTGFMDLDEKIGGGYKPGQLIVVAGRPGMGKTAIALNTAEDLAMRQGLAVGIFSMEMHATELVKRQLAGMAKVHGLRLSHGRIDDAIWAEIGKVTPKLHDAPIFLCEDGYLSIGEITAGARKLKRRAPHLGMIVVDYLGLMRIERPTIQPRPGPRGDFPRPQGPGEGARHSNRAARAAQPRGGKARRQTPDSFRPA
jgi:replicative DNA helicase